MNYIAQLNAFEQWLETHDEEFDIGMTEQLLWYKLMGICNRCDWKEWFTVSLTRLEGLMRCSRPTVIKARNKLEKAGLIEVIPGLPNHQAASYKIVNLERSTSKKSLPVDDRTSKDSLLVNDPTSKGTSKKFLRDPLLLNKLNKTITTTTTPLYPPVSEPEEKAPWVQVVDHYLTVTGRLQNTPIDAQVAQNLCKLSGDDVGLICSTIDRIMERGKVPNGLKYFEQAVADAVALRDNPATEIQTKRTTPNRRNTRKKKTFDADYYDSYLNLERRMLDGDDTALKEIEAGLSEVAPFGK